MESTSVERLSPIFDDDIDTWNFQKFNMYDPGSPDPSVALEIDYMDDIADWLLDVNVLVHDCLGNIHTPQRQQIFECMDMFIRYIK